MSSINSQFINTPNSAGMLWDPNFSNWYPAPNSQIYKDLTAGLSQAEINKYTKGTYAYTQANPTQSKTPYSPVPTQAVVTPANPSSPSSSSSYGPLFVILIVAGVGFLILN